MYLCHQNYKYKSIICYPKCLSKKKKKKPAFPKTHLVRGVTLFYISANLFKIWLIIRKDEHPPFASTRMELEGFC